MLREQLRYFRVYAARWSCTLRSHLTSVFLLVHNDCLCAFAACMHTAAEVAAQREAARAAAAAVAQAESLLLDKPQGASPLFILFPETLNAALCCQAAAAGPRSECRFYSIPQ
jgi:hypothetical protein